MKPYGIRRGYRTDCPCCRRPKDFDRRAAKKRARRAQKKEIVNAG